MSSAPSWRSLSSPTVLPPRNPSSKKGWNSPMRAAHPVAAPSLLLLVFVCGHATAQDARDWLERMNRAVEELNYRGTFVHAHDGTLEMETLHIVHRTADGQSG